MRRNVQGLWVLSVLFVTGCGTTAPQGWLRHASEMHEETYGAWIDVRPTDGRSRLRGELLAATADSVYVLPHRPGQPQASQVAVLGWNEVREADLYRFTSSKGSLAGWVIVGGAATISNGVYMVLTLPMWLIGGPLAISSSRSGQWGYPGKEWHELAAYARFPQGYPSAVPRRDLSPKLSGPTNP